MAFDIIAGRSIKDRDKLGKTGTILFGKHYVQMEKTVSLSNPIYLDVSGPHVILVAGKRGSGKSYSLGVIAEGMADLPADIKKNISTLIFDTMGIFWTMKYPNYRDDALLKQWNLNPTPLNPLIFVPYGLFDNYQKGGVPVDSAFALKPAEISAEEWTTMFNINLISEDGALVERAVETLKETKKEFDIIDIIEFIKNDKRSSDKTKLIVENRFLSARKWGLFSKEGTDITELFRGGQTAILDLSAYAQYDNGERIKALVIGLICKKILEQRMSARKSEEVSLISEGGFLFSEQSAMSGEEAPLVWIFLDESHEFLPREGSTLASQPLIQILREGRQPGISLVLATQQPGKIHTDVMTQADIVISHRVTAKIDVEALSLISATYLPFAIQRYIDELPADKGTAILLDDKQEKIYPMRVRPRYSWHGGEDPTAIKTQLTEYGL